MSNFNSFDQFPSGAEPGSQVWTNFWDDESWGVTPGTRITPEDLAPSQSFEDSRGHVITAAGTLSVHEWFNTFAPETDIVHIY